MLGKRNLVKFLVKNFIFCLFLIIVCSSVFADPTYPEVEKKHLKVGFYEMEGAQKVDKDGNLSLRFPVFVQVRTDKDDPSYE